MQRGLNGTFVIAALAALGLGCPGAAYPQSAKTARIVISVTPGGTIDYFARVLADHVGKISGQTIIIESKPGAGGVIAAETVARAAPDGGTLLVNTNGMIVSALLRRVNFDPIASFEPICFLVSSPQVIVVNSAQPYRTLGDLLDAARARPGELSIASVGPNTTQHIAIERLKRRAGVNLTYVPFQGGTPAINALLGNHVTAVVQNYSEIGPQLQAGTLRALATPSPQRIEPLPDLPTVAELGFPDFSAEVWFGLVTTAKTPADTVAQLIAAFSGALRAPEVREKLVAHALYPKPVCGPNFAAHIRRQTDEFAQVLREFGLKSE
jgi:tripartite-type tricarboxylate transporter receptor subunit TctC